MADHEDRMDDKPTSNEPQEPEFKVFVGGISYKVDERGLKEMFEKFNPVSAIIQVDKMTQRPRGFGFVTFKDRESLLDAVREMHNKEVDGRTISVKEAIPMDQIKPGTRVGGGERRDSRHYSSRDSRYDSRSYDRGYSDRYSYDRGYDRGGYGGSGYSDPRYPAGYDSRSYDRGGYGGGYGSYDRDPYYRDTYARDPYHSYPATGGGGYDRPAYGGDSRYGSTYDSRYPASDYAAYDSDRYRAAGGPERSRYPAAPRPGPYERPPADARRDTRSTR